MTKTFSLMFYNTENFYDTVDDPNTMDDEFTPDGFREWTNDRYNDKVEKLTNVITKIVHPDYPDVISLAEIENKTVMESMLQEMNQRGLKDTAYIMTVPMNGVRCGYDIQHRYIQGAGESPCTGSSPGY